MIFGLFEYGDIHSPGCVDFCYFSEKGRSEGMGSGILFSWRKKSGHIIGDVIIFRYFSLHFPFLFI